LKPRFPFQAAGGQSKPPCCCSARARARGERIDGPALGGWELTVADPAAGLRALGWWPLAAGESPAPPTCSRWSAGLNGDAKQVTRCARARFGGPLGTPLTPVSWPSIPELEPCRDGGAALGPCQPAILEAKSPGLWRGFADQPRGKNLGGAAWEASGRWEGPGQPFTALRRGRPCAFCTSSAATAGRKLLGFAGGQPPPGSPATNQLLLLLGTTAAAAPFFFRKIEECSGPVGPAPPGAASLIVPEGRKGLGPLAHPAAPGRSRRGQVGLPGSRRSQQVSFRWPAGGPVACRHWPDFGDFHWKLVATPGPGARLGSGLGSGEGAGGLAPLLAAVGEGGFLGALVFD